MQILVGFSKYFVKYFWLEKRFYFEFFFLPQTKEGMNTLFENLFNNALMYAPDLQGVRVDHRHRSPPLAQRSPVELRVSSLKSRPHTTSSATNAARVLDAAAVGHQNSHGLLHLLPRSPPDFQKFTPYTLHSHH